MLALQVLRVRRWLQDKLTSQRSVLIVLGLSLCAVVLAYQVPTRQVINVGESGADAYIQGFYFPEGPNGSTFRWSGASAHLSFTGVGRRPWILRLRLSGLRPQGEVSLRLEANGHPLPALRLGGEMTERELTLSSEQIGTLGNAEITLTSPTFVAPPDKRQLGVMVEWARLEPNGPAVVLPPVQILAGLLLLVLLCYSALRRGNLAPVWATLATALVTGVFVVGILRDRMLASHYLPWCIGIVSLLWLCAAWLRRRYWWEWIALAAIVWAGWRFAARALNFYNTGLPQGDFMIYFNAAKNLRLGAPLYDYESARGIPMGPVYKYPPLFAILMAPMTILPAQTLAAAWYLLSLGLVFFSLFMLLRWWGGSGARRRAWSYLITLGFLICQPLWEGLIRGQLDALILAIVVGVLLLLRRKRGHLAAGVLLAFATMLKIYPGLLFLYLLWQRRWIAVKGFVAGFSLMTLLSLVVGWKTMWLYITQILTVQSGAAPYPENQSYDGFLARLFVPAANTTWYTTVPFPRPMQFILYFAMLVTLVLTAWFLRDTNSSHDERPFELGYTALLPLTMLVWPISWIHLESFLFPAYALLLLYEMQAERPSWGTLILLAISFLAVAIGNEYTVLVPVLQTGWARLLQSYKLYGILVLWFLMLHAVRSIPRTAPAVLPDYVSLAPRRSREAG